MKAALKQLGFNVEDIDETRRGEGLPRAEDLQVTCTRRPTVRVIAEVKGYARGGAKASDLIQLGQHAMRYTQREGGQAPDSSWYIVNQFAATDPDTRQPPLAGAIEDVQVFAEGGGLIIDSRELFKLSQMAAGGQVSLERAREELLAQRAVFTCPSAMTT